MKLNLSLVEQRIIGCLVEKQQTTPDQYSLSLKSLTNACNQKLNREPILDLSESHLLRSIKKPTKWWVFCLYGD